MGNVIERFVWFNGGFGAKNSFTRNNLSFIYIYISTSTAHVDSPLIPPCAAGPSTWQSPGCGFSHALSKSSCGMCDQNETEMSRTWKLSIWYNLPDTLFKSYFLSVMNPQILSFAYSKIYIVETLLKSRCRCWPQFTTTTPFNINHVQQSKHGLSSNFQKPRNNVPIPPVTNWS